MRERLAKDERRERNKKDMRESERGVYFGVYNLSPAVFNNLVKVELKRSQ